MTHRKKKCFQTGVRSVLFSHPELCFFLQRYVLFNRNEVTNMSGLFATVGICSVCENSRCKKPKVQNLYLGCFFIFLKGHMDDHQRLQSCWPTVTSEPSAGCDVLCKHGTLQTFCLQIYYLSCKHKNNWEGFAIDDNNLSMFRRFWGKTEKNISISELWVLNDQLRRFSLFWA